MSPSRPPKTVILEYGSLNEAVCEVCSRGLGRDSAVEIIRDAVLRSGLRLQFRHSFRPPTVEERLTLEFEDDKITAEDRTLPISMCFSDERCIARDVSDANRRAVDLNVPDLLDLLDRVTKRGSVLPANGSRGGRPATYDWAAAWREAAAWIYQHGMPAPRADLERYLEAWFESTCGKAPDERELQGRLAAQIKDMERPRPLIFGGKL